MATTKSPEKEQNIIFNPCNKVYNKSELHEMNHYDNVIDKKYPILIELLNNKKSMWKLAIGQTVGFKATERSKERKVKLLGFDDSNGRVAVFKFLDTKTHVMVDALTQGEQIV